MGRPTLCTPEAIAIAVEHAGMGRPDYACAIAAGVEPKTLADWKQKGADGTEPYATFLSRFAGARQDRIKTRLEAIDTAGADDWKAHAWLLERQEPQEFAKSRIQPPELPADASTLDKLDAIARKALEIGDAATALAAVTQAAHLRGEYPGDKAALKAADLDPTGKDEAADIDAARMDAVAGQIERRAKARDGG